MGRSSPSSVSSGPSRGTPLTTPMSSLHTSCTMSKIPCVSGASLHALSSLSMFADENMGITSVRLSPLNALASCCNDFFTATRSDSRKSSSSSRVKRRHSRWTSSLSCANVRAKHRPSATRISSCNSLKRCNVSSRCVFCAAANSPSAYIFFRTILITGVSATSARLALTFRTVSLYKVTALFTSAQNLPASAMNMSWIDFEDVQETFCNPGAIFLSRYRMRSAKRARSLPSSMPRIPL